MTRRIAITLALAAALLCSVGSRAATPSRSERLLRDWTFNGSQKVRIPHDWAIAGPFNGSYDFQTVAVTQNGETEATAKTGRTGGLPWIGEGSYECTVDIEKVPGKKWTLLFDGAMSDARVYVNGEFAGQWPYGYNSFYFDITDHVKDGANTIKVLLNNLPESSRWYPGAGLYRNVHLIETPEVHVPVWGVYITTPYVSRDEAVVSVSTEIEGLEENALVTLETVILDAAGREVARDTYTRKLWKGVPATQRFTVKDPDLWSPDSPVLYTARTTVMTGASMETTSIGMWRNRYEITGGTDAVDAVETRFGIRSIEFRPEQGFFLNGERTMLKGVCNHHDLGPLGSAVNRSALRRQLIIMKDMGCNAIRTSHNMPAPELVELCDEMGIMLMVEPFDEWNVAKCANGYHLRWDEWAEKDMVNMLRHYRSNPSVIMWSIGNEVPGQGDAQGAEVAAWLTSICHREDPTRPVTCGMDQFDGVFYSGFIAAIDIPGFNYKPYRYLQARELLPQGFILGSETASTVSSRGVYHFPLSSGMNIKHPDHQSDSYDLEYCIWSNVPDDDFAADEDYPWMLGQFVWTGFDYLGEPTPYDTDAWPNHSSMFGIVDLAGLPKDRFYLYRSVWNETESTLHVLPHWTWPGREGQTTPVFVYTSYPEAELFINGESQGRRRFNKENLLERHRMMWNDVVYQPGELKVVAYDDFGRVAEEKTVRTAGKPYALQCNFDRGVLAADGDDMAFVTVTVVDKAGNPVPDAANLINIQVSGAGNFEAVANGDPTCLESFRQPKMHLFSGALCFIVRSGEVPGSATFTVTSKGLKKYTGTITVQ